MIIVILLLLVTTFSPAWAASVTVSELAVTTKVSKGQPIDSVHRISHRSVKELFCFSRTSSDASEQQKIRHIWFRNGTKVKEAVLVAKGKNWRTFSTVPIGIKSIGNWRVELHDADNRLIKSREFTVN